MMIMLHVPAPGTRVQKELPRSVPSDGTQPCLVATVNFISVFEDMNCLEI